MGDQPDVENSKPATPFPEMWAAGRAAFFRAATTYPEATCLTLSAMSGSVDVLFRFVGAGTVPSENQRALWIFLLGPIWGILRNYALAAGVWAVGRALGGSGTYRDLRGSVAWASIPLAVLLVVTLPVALFLGDGFFRLTDYAERGSGPAALLGLALGLAAIAAAAKSLMLLVSAVKRQHQLGTARTIMSILGGMLLTALAVVGVVLLMSTNSP